MNASTVTTDLAQIADERVLLDVANDLTERWKAASLGVDTVGPVLQLMEAHPNWDFGVPGALAHYVERFYKHGYEAMLVESLKRRPTSHTLWMLNRLINGEKNADSKRQYLALLASVSQDPAQDAAVKEQAAEFLSLHAS